MGVAIVYGFLFTSLYFEVFMLIAFLQNRLYKRRVLPVTAAHEKAALPTVAIVVPCFNEARTVAGTLQSLLAIEYPAGKLEFLVVDDGSTDKTLEIARSFEHDPRVRVFTKQNGGKHTAMNLALANTNAQVIGCLDADSTVERGALMRIVPVFADASIAAVTPGIHVRAPKTALQHMQHVEYQLAVFNRYMLAGLGSAFITPGPFSFFRASVVRELGGWRHAHSTEDMEMALRIQTAGYGIANAPTAIVHTATPATLHGLFRQRVRWTYGWLRNAADYRHMIGNRAFGDLGIIILPSALISIGAGIFFFARLITLSFSSLSRQVVRYEAVGIQPYHPHFDLFFFSTSALWFIILVSIVIVLLLISAGARIGTGSARLPRATPLFLLLYCFIAPLWLCAALARATFRTGVRWR